MSFIQLVFVNLPPAKGIESPGQEKALGKASKHHSDSVRQRSGHLTPKKVGGVRSGEITFVRRISYIMKMVGGALLGFRETLLDLTPSIKVFSSSFSTAIHSKKSPC